MPALTGAWRPVASNISVRMNTPCTAFLRGVMPVRLAGPRRGLSPTFRGPSLLPSTDPRTGARRLGVGGCYGTCWGEG